MIDRSQRVQSIPIMNMCTSASYFYASSCSRPRITGVNFLCGANNGFRELNSKRPHVPVTSYFRFLQVVCIRLPSLGFINCRKEFGCAMGRNRYVSMCINILSVFRCKCVLFFFLFPQFCIMCDIFTKRIEVPISNSHKFMWEL